MGEVQKLKVYYDGACHLCSREVDMYRKKDPAQKLVLIDISNRDFSAEAEGLDTQDVQINFHVKMPDGRILKGVPAFAAIWNELNIMRPLSTLYSWPGIKQLMDRSYTLFTKIRPLLPRRQCEDGTCKI
jgi:predicted DCC family thiol-disulfide oxidoreductase YuxK